MRMKIRTRTGARFTTACALLIALPAHAQTPPSRAADGVAGSELVGLWGSETTLGPQVRGELLLQRQGDAWSMRVGGFEVHGVSSGDTLVLALPGGQGMLRARLLARATPASAPSAATTQVMDAFWVQPAGDGAPAYAVPLRLVRAGNGSWRATLAPLDARFPLYLMVTRGADGSLGATFRNPAANWPGRAGAYGVVLDGDQVTFLDPRTRQPRYRQPYDSAAGRITFDFGSPIVLTRRLPEQAVGFFPRSPSVPPYAYRMPMDLGDGWRAASAGSLGVDAAALQSIVQGLVRVDPLNDSLPRVHSLLVARRGRLVLDEYFHGTAADQLHDLRSASKTITSVMVGAAMHGGARLDASTTVLDGAGNAPITVGHLLSHTAGLACDDDDDTSPGNEDTMQQQSAEPDWYRFTRALPRLHPPGTTYSYCSGGINLVGQVIADAAHRWLPDFFDRAVARPLGISHFAMNLMPTGQAYAGGGLQLRPRDLLKVGQLYLDGGVWNGTRVVSADWVARSTARHADRADGSTDGYGWHRHVLRVGGRDYQSYEAGGNGGQFVVVVPDLALVVATTAGSYGQYAAWRRIREELVTAVMAAVR